MIGPFDLPRVVYRYALGRIELTPRSIEVTPPFKEFTRGVENLDPVIVCVRHVDVPCPVHGNAKRMAELTIVVAKGASSPESA